MGNTRVGNRIQDVFDVLFLVKRLSFIGPIDLHLNLTRDSVARLSQDHPKQLTEIRKPTCLKNIKYSLAKVVYISGKL